MSWPDLLRARLGRAPRTTGGTTPQKTWKRRLKKVVVWSAVTAVVLALLGVAGFVYVYKTTDIPEPNAEFLTEASFVYYADGKEELGQYSTQYRASIPLADMPESLKQAVVAAEDQTFYTNNGIDTRGIVRAVLNNAKGGSTQGASTITQQYVKILYLTQERSYQRKVKEAILSLKIQREYSKDEVLEGYLNTIYFGRGAYGVEAAADVYFGKTAAELDLRESAVLASVLNDPNDLDPADGKDARRALRGRYQYVLGQMGELGYVPAEEADQASKRLPKFPELEAESTYGGQKGHMLTLIKDELLALRKNDGEFFTEEEIDGGGLSITTTLRPEVMTAIEDGVEEVRPTEGEGFTKPGQLHVGAATVEPGTGALRGFYAGQDYLDSQINWAVAGGQAGSTFKPFAIAAALKDGYSLDSTFEGNSPYVAVDGSEFENQGDSDYGTVDLVKATEDSINTAFIDLTISMDDGPEKIIAAAEEMGIPPARSRPRNPGIPNVTPGLEPQTGVALGSQTVSPINMANGYATIANQGVAHEVYVIEKVTDSDGEVLYAQPGAEKRAMSADIASDVSFAMQQVIESGSGSSNAPLPDGRPAAGKTGTATKEGGAVSSSWFVGFTPQLSTAVVYLRGTGNGQLDGWLPTSSDGLEGYFGGNYPAKTWNAIMTREHEDLPIEEFPEPAFVDGNQENGVGGEVDEPAPAPAPAPEPEPTRQPTREPEPTQEPTQEPTVEPSPEPTQEPTEDPCGLLGCPPTQEPSPSPSPSPTQPPPSPTPSAAPRPSPRPSPSPGREQE